jgi:hypothetical protein
MEITKEQIQEAITKDPTIIEVILPTVIESEVGKKLVENKANLIFTEKIGEEIKKVHQRYDEDLFEVLGVRAGTGEDGAKEKTYEVARKMYGQLKELQGQKESLSKDVEVQRLTGEIEKLKLEGGGKHIQGVFDQAKLQWETERQGFVKQIGDTKTETESFQKRTDIKSALNQLKFNPDTPESVKTMILTNVEESLIKNSKFENGKLVFVDPEGKPIINQTSYEPKNPLEMLMSLDAIKDITLKDDKKPGGNAQAEIHGSIKTISIEGKDEQSLILPEGSFKSRSEFNEVAQKALLDSGVTRKDPRWNALLNKAYKENKVDTLPAK